MNSEIIKNFYAWPKQLRFIVAVIISLIIFIVIYFLDLSHLSSVSASASVKEAELKQQIEFLISKQASLKRKLKLYQNVEPVLANIRSQLITKNEIPEIMNSILKSGTAGNLTFEQFTPEEIIQKDDYAIAPVKANLKGSYHDIGHFLSGIADYSKLIIINDFTISSPNQSSPGDTKLNANVQLDLYQLAEKAANEKSNPSNSGS